MIEINLLPDVKQELIKAQKIRSMVISFAILIGSVSIAVVVLLALYVYTVQGVRSNAADEDIKKRNKTLTSFEDLSKTLTIQNQLSKISALNDNKKIYSRTFDMINMIIPPSPNAVTISDLTINSDSYQVAINGQAENSYAALEVFRKTIEGAKVRYTDLNKETIEVDLATDISTTNTNYGEDSSGKKVLRFTIGFVCAKELFSIDSKDALVVIAIDGNATDSYRGIPKSIFAERAKDIESGSN